MNRIKNKVQKSKFLLFVYRSWLPFIDFNKFLASMRGLFWYVKDFFKYILIYKKKISIMDLYPILDEKTKETGVDYQYLYQQLWVFNEIFNNKPENHYDIGSTYQMSGYIAAITKAHFVDIRPIKADIPNLEVIPGSIEKLPFKDSSIDSLSCLHVIEHIGLGRYGDSLNPNGSQIAAKELSRVLKKGGFLYLSTPIGRERICFNAHRVFDPKTIIEYFKDLQLVEFNYVDDLEQLHRKSKIKNFNNSEYSLGMFKFTKK